MLAPLLCSAWRPKGWIDEREERIPRRDEHLKRQIERSLAGPDAAAVAEALAPFTRRQPNDGAERPLLKRLDWSAIYARVQVVETLILNALARRMAEDDEDDDEVLILNG